MVRIALLHRKESLGLSESFYSFLDSSVSKADFPGAIPIEELDGIPSLNRS